VKTHGTRPRGLRPPPLSPQYEGRFGRLFRKLPPAPPLPPGQLEELASSMREPEPPEQLDNPDIPAGHTYFGQFVDHDITFDPASSLERENDPDALHNFRTPRFDLDSVYGSGPADEPFQYDDDQPGKLLIGESNGQQDLPRNVQGTALIGDPRNDENIIVSGLQLVFLLLHNKLFDEVAADPAIPEERRFEETQQRVRWHYQWVLVKDFLRHLVGDQVLAYLFGADPTTEEPAFRLRHYNPRVNAYMPVEFSVAAYRFGHSQVRPVYNLNATVTDRPIFAPGDEVGELDDLRGGRELPAKWAIDWGLFLPIDGPAPQPSRLIDARLAAGLFDLPGIGADEPQSLAERNLLRGEQFKLPSGQDVARYLGVEPLSGAELGAPEPTPLWFYVLKESELTPKDPHDPGSGGRQLGKVGARIVGEVLLGILQADPKAWVNVNPAWQPTVPAANEDEGLTLADLVKYATEPAT
jgi:Animal haem peroxidase